MYDRIPQPVEQLTEAQADDELARLAQALVEHDRRYYEDDAPTISDADYDALKRRSSALESRFPTLSQRDAPNSTTGLDPTPSNVGPTLQAAYPIDNWPPPPEPKTPRARRWTPVDYVSIENFKAIDKARVALGTVTILVGPNGSGKSSALQAIHWAARCASYIAPKNGKEMIAFERIDYLPSSEPLKTAYRGELKPGSNTRPTGVSFQHEPTGEEKQGPVAAVKLWAARNKGGITAHIEGGGAVSPYKQRASFITAYIPGLAGLAERETILAQPSLRRQAASGDAGGVLRNILLGLTVRRNGEADNLQGQKRLERLNQLIQDVHPGISVRVSFDEREDFNISAGYTDSGLVGGYRSLETAATGVLQVIQIFAYLVSFRPKLLLIDEPDAHLHPDKQERLIEALEKAAPEFETQVILTTHSPNIARAASPKAKLVWMSEGEVKTEDDETIRRLMGWGGLDRQALFFVEDEDDGAIRAILRQWPDLARRVAVCRCFGVDNLPKDTLLRALLKDGELGLRALIHRDRDFMTDEEAGRWIQLYKTEGVRIWITTGCDVESYFCDASYLAVLYGVGLEEAEAWRTEAAGKVTRSRDTFFAKRGVITRVIWPTGGGPDAVKLWDQDRQTTRTVLGKALLSALKPVISKAGHDDKLINYFPIPPAFEVAPDLKKLLSAVTA